MTSSHKFLARRLHRSVALDAGVVRERVEAAERGRGGRRAPAILARGDRTDDGLDSRLPPKLLRRVRERIHVDVHKDE